MFFNQQHKWRDWVRIPRRERIKIVQKKSPTNQLKPGWTEGAGFAYSHSAVKLLTDLSWERLTGANLLRAPSRRFLWPLQEEKKKKQSLLAKIRSVGTLPPPLEPAPEVGGGWWEKLHTFLPNLFVTNWPGHQRSPSDPPLTGGGWVSGWNVEGEEESWLSDAPTVLG